MDHETLVKRAVEGDRAALTDLLVEHRGIVAAVVSRFLWNKDKGRYSRFAVVTPHTVITVKGTVFRVEVGDEETRVVVYEGAVEVSHQGRRYLVDTLGVGGAGVADSDSLVSSAIDNSGLARERGVLLRDYLEWLSHETDRLRR